MNSHNVKSQLKGILSTLSYSPCCMLEAVDLDNMIKNKQTNKKCKKAGRWDEKYKSVHKSRKRARREITRKMMRCFIQAASPTAIISAVVVCLCTLFTEFSEKAEACDGRSSEDDCVLAGDVLAELLGHKTVELRLILQGGQTICALALLQMDWDLQREGKT